VAIVVEHDTSSGVTIVWPEGDLVDSDRNDLRKVIYKLLAQSPKAIIIDLSAVSQMSPLIQMTLLAMAVEAAREPSMPLLLCTPAADLARSLSLNGPSMQVYPAVAEARRALVTAPHKIEWLQRPLGRSSHAPDLAGSHLSQACGLWQLPWMQMPASAVAFDLAALARGPYELHLTVSLRSQWRLLINVRNYVIADRTSREHSRMRLNPIMEARIIDDGAVACSQLVTGAGVAWWASLNCEPPD